jgi:hypothetical protein
MALAGGGSGIDLSTSEIGAGVVAVTIVAILAFILLVIFHPPDAHAACRTKPADC